MTARAIVFDLDDTLYPERRFLVSGFLAVAAEIERTFSVPRQLVTSCLARELAAGRRPAALQAMCAAFELPLSLIPQLVHVIRSHQPRLRLAPSTRRTLQALGRDWRVGILTNGDPAIQSRKVAALDLSPLVDAVVYAQEHGHGGGKPDAACFRHVCARLDVTADRCVFVGNDVERDVDGAHRAGLAAIHLYARRDPARPAANADAVVHRLIDVPPVAERLLQGELLWA